MNYNTAIIYLTANENFISFSTIDGYVYRDPLLGFSFTYNNILSSATFLGLSGSPALSALPSSAYTNTSTFLSSNNIVVRRHEFNEFIFTGPVVINYSLKNVQQSLYKIEKIIGYLNGNIIENNIDLLNSSTSFLNGITATYETPSEFSKTYNESISCYRENFYVDVFDISFRINQPSLFDITSKYKIINYQILDDNHSYLLTLQGYEDRNIHYAVLGTDSTIFVSPSSITRTYPNLNFSIS